jgi:tetratricopeptide (TPR) repeat protein
MRCSTASLPFVLLATVGAAQGAAPEIKWWQGDLASAIAGGAEAKSGLALIYCWRDDPICAAMYQDTILAADVVQALQDFVCVSAKLEDPNGKIVHQRYSAETLPELLFVRPDGSIEDVLIGQLAAPKLLEELARIRGGNGTMPQLRSAVAEKPDDFALQLALAKKLRSSGNRGGAAKCIDAILAKDPKGASEPAAEAMLLRVVEATFKPGLEPKDVDLKALRSFAQQQKQKRVQFLAWDRVAAAEWRRNNVKGAADAVEKAWKVIPPEDVLDWGNRVVAYAYEFRAELDKTQQKLALEIGKRSIAAAEAEAKSRPDGNQWLAQRLYTFAACQLFNNQRKDAFATMERAIQLDPSNENLKKALEAWKEGIK